VKAREFDDVRRIAMEQSVTHYFQVIDRLCRTAEATRLDGTPLALGQAIESMIEDFRRVGRTDNKIMFVGNGGSAGIASHMAIDFTKNGDIAAMAFSDAAALTCLGNDLGYEQVFARQISAHARPGDLLIAISSSGRSPNIVNAVAAARGRDCRVHTLSGFSPDNPLRRLGDHNLHVASDQYGLVEVSHQALLHCLLDHALGWDGRVKAEDAILVPAE
jgi:D-sedoheptulose 7-phosphate isomerase